MNVQDRYEWLCNADIEASKRFYESVYRGCLNPLDRLKRAFTHKCNGARRFQ
jgi:hypothetical protein